MAHRTNSCKIVRLVFLALISIELSCFSVNGNQLSQGANPIPTGEDSPVPSQIQQSKDSNLPSQVVLPNVTSVSLTNKTSSDSWNSLTTAGQIAVSAFGIVVTLYLGLGRYNRRKDKMATLEGQLNSFHRPLLQLLETSAKLRDALVEKRPADFRTLPVLLERPEEFDMVDHVLINQIVGVGCEIEKIILKRSGHLMDESLREPLGTLCRHLMIFRLAADKKLKGNSDRFRHFVYPRDVSKRIREEYDRLTLELQECRKKIW